MLFAQHEVRTIFQIGFIISRMIDSRQLISILNLRFLKLLLTWCGCQKVFSIRATVTEMAKTKPIYVMRQHLQVAV